MCADTHIIFLHDTVGRKQRTHTDVVIYGLEHFACLQRPNLNPKRLLNKVTRDDLAADVAEQWRE